MLYLDESQKDLASKMSEVEELERCLYARESECDSRYRYLIDMDQQLTVLDKELQQKEIELGVREEIVKFAADGIDLNDIVLKQRESELRAKKLTCDMYRVQEKLAKAYRQIGQKDSTILSLNNKIERIEKYVSGSSGSEAVAKAGDFSQHQEGLDDADSVATNADGDSHIRRRRATADDIFKKGNKGLSTDQNLSNRRKSALAVGFHDILEHSDSAHRVSKACVVQ